MRTVMIIRHGEKPDLHNPGLDEQLRPDEESLTVHGWDRARKLPGLFTATGGGSDGDTVTGGADRGALGTGAALPLPLPAVIYASGQYGPVGGARRHEQTVTPLAEQLGLKVHTAYGKREEQLLAQDVLGRSESPVLICWQHSRIPRIVRALGADTGIPVPPESWPTDRFDLVWVFRYEAAAGRWHFRQVDQGLLDGDR